MRSLLDVTIFDVGGMLVAEAVPDAQRWADESWAQQ